MTSLKRPSEEEDLAGGGGCSRKKAATSTRTGQACDRCKVRKIRCDARPGGCTPCVQNNSECKTTDRITGRATSRGHAEHLENENTTLRLHIIELQSQLRHNGVEPGPPPPLVPPGYPPPQLQYGALWDGQQSSGYAGAQADHVPSQGSLLPEFRSGCIGDNYLGVASENNWLSPIEGTSLALFGTKIDLAEFMPQEPNPDASAMSYQTFLHHAFAGSHSAQRPELPAYDQCKIFAEWYFRSIQQFTPLLHKPDFMHLLIRIYHENHQPSPAEAVMVHMMLAVMNFQWSARNVGGDQTRSTSFEHYHYALTFIPQLIAGHKLEDVQALALICSQLRNQPRPGAAWMFTNMVFGLAVELGLHRSAKAWRSTGSESEAHIIEMRKRIFWSLLIFHVNISGKLGRPMPIRLQDFDIEIPEVVNDNLPSEANLAKWKKCSFRAAIQGFKLLRIMMQTYSTVYSIGASKMPYEVNIGQIEKDLQGFHSQVPPELSGGPQTQVELLLHHPSLCRSNSPQTAASNLDACLEASNKMLMAASHLRQLKSLDTTWYYGTDFLAAIFTTLFAFTEKRDLITSEHLQRLRQDMDVWLDIMGEVGRLLGGDTKLQDAVRTIVEYSLSLINRHLTTRTASAAMASANTPPGAPGQEQQQQAYGQDYYAHANNGTTNGDMSAPQQQRPFTMSGEAAHADAAQHPYPSGTQFTYPEPQQYNANNMAAYDPSAYNADALKSSIDAQLNAELAPPPPSHHQTPQLPPHHQQAPVYMSAMQSPAAGLNGYPPAPTPNMQASWRNFTDHMVHNLGTQDAYAATNSPGLPLATGGDNNPTNPSLPASAGSFGGMQMPTDGSQTWPLIQFNTADAGHNGGGGQ